MTDIVFTPLGDADWITPIAKAGKAGRDGDGDGILNEGKKRSAGEDAATVGGVGAAAAAGGIGGKVVGDKLVSRVGLTMTRTAPNTYKPVLGIRGANRIRGAGALAGAVAGTAVAASLLNPRLKQIKDDLNAAIDRSPTASKVRDIASYVPGVAGGALGAAAGAYAGWKSPVARFAAGTFNPDGSVADYGVAQGALSTVIAPLNVLQAASHGAQIGYRAANIRKAESEKIKAITKSNTPTFAPIGADDFIEKAGKAGRDGDGDGVLNEKDKRTAVASGAVAGAGAGAAVGAAAGRKIGERFAVRGSGARGKQWLAAAHNMTPAGTSRRPAVRTAVNLFSASEAARSAKFGAKGRLGGGLLGLVAGGALAGYGVNRALSKSITKAYASDVTEILASDIEDKASAIAKAGQELAESVSSVNLQLEIEKADGPVDFATSVARIEISKACAEIEQITSEMVETLTKSVSEDPSTLESAVEKFDADMAEFLSALEEEEDEPQPVAKAAAPVFQPLA